MAGGGGGGGGGCPPRRASPPCPAKKSAPGTPKRHRTSLSAATGEVLTRFTRRRPSDLGQREYTGVEGEMVGGRGPVRPRARLPHYRPLPLLHLAQLPGLGHHAAQEKDDRGVIDPEDEETRGADV